MPHSNSIDFTPFFQALENIGADEWLKSLPPQLENALAPTAHGTLTQWFKIIAELPQYQPSRIELNVDAVTIGTEEDLNPAELNSLRERLLELFPWRKGPFQLYGIDLNTEWRSDWKWQRLKPHISSLKHRLVLDVGCGNGYHCWRMLGDGAKLVIGVDHTLLNVMQFYFIKKLYGQAPAYVLPLGIEDLPSELELFDTVFSMGVLYHQRSPIEHLQSLRECLKPDGELVLETLIIEGGAGQVLVPEGRYARMRNVWFIPSAESLMTWLRRCGFKNIRLVDVNQTSIEEQRSTQWMPFQSLNDFLNPENPSLTIEGLPAPRRGIFIANR